MLPETRYRLRQLSNGLYSVHSIESDETFHPGVGPAAEAEALYVKQLRLPERVLAEPGEFVLWDVGLGAAANALTAIRLIGEAVAKASLAEGTLKIVSFDQTLDAAGFALTHAEQLGYMREFEGALAGLIEKREARFAYRQLKVCWTVELGDFPELLNLPDNSISRTACLPPPHAILFDPHSPRKNPAMWTVLLFRDLFRRLDPARPCSLANFTRSTLARAAMLLGGFFVGAGHPSGMKEETTVAANRLELLEEPLDRRWLERARRSDSAEPLWEPVYRQARLSPETLRRLEEHPQFRG